MTPGAALALLTIPYVFTQDGLLTTGDFIARAKERGHELSPDLLQDLHNLGLLKPFYRVSDFPVSGRQLDVEVRDGPNARGWTFQAGADGRLRDSEEEGYSSAWPYSRQPDEHDRRWWNGFVYSDWQLVYVGHALTEPFRVTVCCVA